MDFGFAPGGTAHDGRVRQLFQRRANTTLIHTRTIATVRAFVDHLATSGTVARPIDDALIGAHANSEAWIFIPMFGGQDGPTSYEILEETLADPAKSIALQDAVIGHNPGDPITHSVHFKGCNIGKAQPFLAKFREALGDHVNVTAPKHFHGITPERRLGTFEYMAYEFSLRRPSDFPNRAAVLAAYQAAGFTYLDGTAVAAADWNPWIPRRINKTRTFQEPAPLGIKLGTRRTIRVPRQFRVDRLPFKFTTTFQNAASVPAPAARQAEFERVLALDPRFDAAHAFPAYERLGYASFADFIAGYTWTHPSSGRRMNTRGRRTEYTVVVVIMDRVANHLIFNYHPAAGSPHAAITTGLQENNGDFFETV